MPTERTRPATASARIARDILGPAVGLACWISTLLLYSNTVTPFQRFDGTQLFVGDFAIQSLSLAAVASLALAAAALFGRFVPRRALHVAGATLYVGGAAAFCASCLLLCDATGALATLPLSAAVAVGSVLTGLAWGRVFKGLDARRSLAAVAGAAVFSAAFWAASAVAVPRVLAAAFVLEAAVAALLPALSRGTTMDDPCGEDDLTIANLRERSVAKRMGSFVDVAAPALVGLLAFAFVMGTMRASIVEAFPVHLGVAVACAVVLGALALAPTRRPLTHLAYRSLIPTLAVLLLAVGNISSAISGDAGQYLGTVMVFLLYTLAALLTLSTLGAIAHAGEFPSDLVFSVALFLFCAASLCGLACAPVMNGETVRISTTVITTVYAFLMVIIANIRAERSGSAGPGEAFYEADDASGASGGGEALGFGGVSAGGPRDGGAAGCAPGGAGGAGAPGGTTLAAGAAGGATLAAGGAARRKAGSREVADASRRTLSQNIEALALEHHLTGREQEILGHLAEGHGSGWIGDALYISPNTVRTHIHNIYRKLGTNSREEVIELVKKTGRKA